jgi:hypothetical protein
MLTLKPKGRGNWRTTTVQISGAHQLPFMFSVGQLISLGGVVFRICEVKP